jgi:hypothetical protein
MTFTEVWNEGVVILTWLLVLVSVVAVILFRMIFKTNRILNFLDRNQELSDQRDVLDEKMDKGEW